MYLDGEILTRVDELDKERELVAELLIDAVADKETFIFVDELDEVETEIDVTDDTALDGHGFMTGDSTDLPGLTDIGLGGKDALERSDSITAPYHSAEVGLELVWFHRN